MKTILIASQTLDGFIAKSAKQKSLSWTSREDLKHFIKITKQAGVVIMGRKTYDTIADNYKPLKDRLNIILTKTPQKSGHDNLIYTNDSPKKIIKDLAKKGFKQVAICGGASIYSLFLENNLVDQIYLTIEPILFGTGIPLFNQKTNTKLKLMNIEKANENGTLFLQYQIIKPKK